MIVDATPKLRRLARSLVRPVLSLIAWDVLIVVAYKVLGWHWVASGHIPLALYGSAIGIVVGFRNNSAYSRWWEARTIWGQIVNNSRNLARQVCSALHSDPDQTAMKRKIVYHQIAFAHALRQQLRDADPIAPIHDFVSPEEIGAIAIERNVPLALQRRIGAMMNDARHRGWIDNWEFLLIENTLSDLMSSQGGTERLANTPMPKQYDFFVMIFVMIYCMLLPIGMVEGLGWFTPLGSTLVGFMFLALDRIGRSLEDPFDNTVYDVPLTALTNTIEINLRQMLGETELPESTRPVDGVLW